MRIFFYMGRNAGTKSGVSWKIWKIKRQGTRVVVWWGPAQLVHRKVRPKRSLQSRTRRFSSTIAAEHFLRERIRSKIAKGYESRTRFRS
jgi:hypothetical protein